MGGGGGVRVFSIGGGTGTCLATLGAGTCSDTLGVESFLGALGAGLDGLEGGGSCAEEGFVSFSSWP